MSAKDGHDQGFTLVEVIVSALIFVLITTATITIIINSIRTVRENADRVGAANIARSEVDRVRALGAENITPGLTSKSVTTSEGSFNVSTTANWVGLNQTSSACDSVSPGQSYMRVHVEVSGATLSGAEIADTIVTPGDDSLLNDVGSLAISVVDAYGEPVSNVTLAGANLANGANTFSYVTGPDGCVFVPKLTPSASWRVTISRPGFVGPTKTSNVSTAQVNAGATTGMDFLYAQAAALTFRSPFDEYPIPDGVPLSMGVDPMITSAVPVAKYPYDATNLWPNPSGYQAWLGTCIDADPASFAKPRSTAVNRTWYAVTPGQTKDAELNGVRVKIRGLPKNTTLTIEHATEQTGNCQSVKSYVIGTTNDLGILKVLLPYGEWKFVVTGTPNLTVPLDPKFPAAVLNFPVASLDVPCVTPTPTPTPTGTATSTPTPTATYGSTAPASPCAVTP